MILEMNSEYIISALIITLSVFVLTILIERKLVPVLRAHKAAQIIYKEGPYWHEKTKAGTPTMGGLGFILATLVVMTVAFIIAWVRSENKMLIPLALTYGLAVMNGAIGYMDDYAKLIKKKNQGFKEYQKFILQVLIAVLYTVAMKKTGYLSDELLIPFAGISVRLGWFYYVIVVVYITGMVNSSNFTDGIDGLLSSASAVIALFLIVSGMMLENKGLVMLSSALLGGVCGFLCFNYPPAKVFMGDTGSLFIGGAVAGAAVMTNQLILILIASIIFVCETASVILQRGYFKLTHGKRIFKMAPIHHHFEMCGWNEKKIDLVFSTVTLIFCIVAGIGIWLA